MYVVASEYNGQEEISCLLGFSIRYPTSSNGLNVKTFLHAKVAKIVGLFFFPH